MAPYLFESPVTWSTWEVLETYPLKDPSPDEDPAALEVGKLNFTQLFNPDPGQKS